MGRKSRKNILKSIQLDKVKSLAQALISDNDIGHHLLGAGYYRSITYFAQIKTLLKNLLREEES